MKAITSLAGIREKSPGIFYLKTIPFLHFHDQDGKRWADVKTLDGWRHLAIDFDATSAAKAEFIAATRLAHAELTKKQKPT